AGAEAGRVSGRLRHSMRFVILIPKSLDPVVRGRAMPLPEARPSAKIAKLFPQADPLKNPQKDQTAAAPAVTAVAQAVPLPEARPAIKPRRHAWRHRTYRRYRSVR
ncbi:MAG: rane-bound lytic murein transglycosylase, partial [Bradyrhizobium sp.]|nr:rane-bound lytic murein transglycosylase [Bradyrhizobium sp.]